MFASRRPAGKQPVIPGPPESALRLPHPAFPARRSGILRPFRTLPAAANPARAVRWPVVAPRYHPPVRGHPLLRLQLYILRRLATSLLLVVVVVSTVLFIGQTVRFLERMPDVGLGFVLAILPMLLPVTLALTLPFAFLVAAVLTDGRLADDNEVIAMRMAGMHPWAVIAPGVFAGIVLSFFCLDLWGNRAPAAIAGQDDLRGDVYLRFLELVERSGKNSFTGRELKISWAGIEGGELKDLHISRGAGSSDGALEIHAGRGVLQRDPTGGVLVFDLHDFVWVTFGPGRPSSSRGGGIAFAISASDLLGVQGSVAKPRALTFEELLFRAFRMPPKSEVRNEMEREILGRISISLAPFCFALCGIPLALLVGRRSRAAAAILAFAVAIAFFVAWQAGNSMAANGAAPLPLAMFAGNIVLAVAGAGFLRAVVRR
jgi:lipopolysaccharide export system permease protein